jgi:hypothetical protein
VEIPSAGSGSSCTRPHRTDRAGCSYPSTPEMRDVSHFLTRAGEVTPSLALDDRPSRCPIVSREAVRRGSTHRDRTSLQQHLAQISTPLFECAEKALTFARDDRLFNSVCLRVIHLLCSGLGLCELELLTFGHHPTNSLSSSVAEIGQHLLQSTFVVASNAVSTPPWGLSDTEARQNLRLPAFARIQVSLSLRVVLTLRVPRPTTTPAQQGNLWKGIKRLTPHVDTVSCELKLSNPEAPSRPRPLSREYSRNASLH